MTIVTIFLMALVTYLPRLAGLSLARLTLPPFWTRFLRFVPVAVFAALIAPALPSADETPIRLVAAATAALVLWRVRALWLGLLVGMVVFWGLRALYNR
jgi:branched-subunit amino acid transport protein